LLRVHSVSGDQSFLSTPVLFIVTYAIAVAVNIDIFVEDSLGPIVRVDPVSGAQTLISTGGYLQRPQGIAVNGKNVYVTDVATEDMNFGVGRIIRIDQRNGNQTVLSEAGNLVGPVGITVAPNGDLIVGDPYTINPESADLFDG